MNFSRPSMASLRAGDYAYPSAVVLCDTCGRRHLPLWAKLLQGSHSSLCSLFSRSSSRRTRAKRASARRSLVTSIVSYSVPSSHYLDVRVAVSASQRPSFPLDTIDVPALDHVRVGQRFPHLAEVISLFRSLSKFRSLFTSDSVLPRVSALPTRLPSRDAIRSLVAHDIVRPIHPDRVKCAVSLFTVPKPGKQVSRLIVNACPVNAAMQPPPHFNLPTFESVRSSVFRFRYATKIDLRHCFYQFQLAPAISAFFAFRPNSSGWHSVHRLPMGWSYAPFICQQVSEAYASLSGLATHVILDDWLFLGHEPLPVQVGTNSVLRALADDGISAHLTKSILSPVQSFEFIGVEWDLVLLRHRLCPAFVDKWLPWFRLVQSTSSMSVRSWVAVASALFYASRVMLLPQSRFWSVYRWISDVSSRIQRGVLTWSSMIKPWTDALSCMRYFLSVLEANAWVQFVSLLPPPYSLYSDASPAGWCFAAVGRDGVLGARFSTFATQRAIHVLELEAIVKALSFVAPKFPGTQWVLFCDNAVATVHANRLRGSCYFSNSLVSSLAHVLESNGSALQVIWVPTTQQLADPWTRVLPSDHPPSSVCFFGSFS